MVFAVTPTGLERISFEKYWKECERNAVILDEDLLEKVKSDENWKELNSKTNTDSFVDIVNRNSTQEGSLLFIDHEIDGYETCLEDNSNSLKAEVKTNNVVIKFEDKQTKLRDRFTDENLIRQMLPYNIQPIVFPPKNTTNIKLVEYYNDQEECLEEIKKNQQKESSKAISKHRKKFKVDKVNDRIKINNFYNDEAECWEEIRKKEKLEEKNKIKKKELSAKNKELIAKKLLLKFQEPSEESTDLEVNYTCHKCFLENYEYELKRYIEEANSCKYCAVLREILEPQKGMLVKSRSSPALFSLDSFSMSETEDEDNTLMVPTGQIRRKSAGPLRFLVPSRRPSFAPPFPSPKMTVSIQSDPNAAKGQSERWGPPRCVTLKRDGNNSLGISIVGGKVDIVGNSTSDEEKKPIFGIFIKNVVPNTPAGLSGQLQSGDRILEVEGVCVRNAQHERAVQLIKSAGDTVTLTVQSLLTWKNDSSTDTEVVPSSPAPSVKRKSPPIPKTLQETPEHEIKITVTSEPDPEVEKEAEEKKKEVYSDDSTSDDDEDEEDNRELEGRTYSEKGVEIDRASAAAVKRSKEEKEADPEVEDEFGYTTSEWRPNAFALFNFGAYLLHVYVYVCLTEYQNYAGWNI